MNLREMEAPIDILTILAREVAKRPLKTKLSRPYCVSEPFQEIQIDLADLVRLREKNDNLRYILVAVDTFSRFTWMHGLETKRPKEIRNVLQKLFFRKGVKPRVIFTDRGTEFSGNEVQNLLSDWGTRHWKTNNHAHLSERKIQTLKRLLSIEMDARGVSRWIPHLARICRKMNNAKNRFVGYKPAEIMREWLRLKQESPMWKKIKEKFDQRCGKTRTPQVTRFTQNELVRISLTRSVFSKKSTGNFSREIFAVHRIGAFTRPPTYVLRDRNNEIIQGRFVDEELQKTIIKRIISVGKQYSICLLHGFDGEFAIPNRFLL